MHDAVVVLKDGRFYEAPIWTWRPREGYMELVDLVRVDFRDIAEAYKWDRSNFAGVLEKQDLLARARKDGWDGT